MTALETIEATFAPYEYRISTLPNGLRLVYRHTDSRVAYIGVAVNAGSRDENEGQFGLAHFVEHTLFKGTSSRSSFRISERMESVGGELNAYTTKENTVFYTIAPAGDPSRAIELLADLIWNPTFPETEIEREKEVVVEEIKAYLDNPAEALFDMFEKRMFEGSDLGHDILGTPESVQNLRRTDCLDFVSRLYTPGEMVLFVQSPDNFSKIEKLAFRYFGDASRPDSTRRRRRPSPSPSFRENVDRNGHQAHTLIGMPAFSRHDPRRFSLLLLNNHLAGPSMNSLLNRELREKRGLVYTVDSNPSLLSDCGTEYIYFGADMRSTSRCLNLISKELARLASHLPTPSALERMKRQYCGQLLVNSDNAESTAMAMGRSVLLYDEVRDSSMTAREVASVSAEQFLETARLLRDGADHSMTLH